MPLARTILLTLVLSLVAAVLGVWGGARYVEGHVHHQPGLHDILHKRLALSGAQQAKLEVLEKDHAAKRVAFEAEMQAANVELAQAYQESHAYTPKVQAAIDRFHHAMDALQKETMIHVIAMRGLLTPSQASQFDDSVVKSLTASGS